MKSSLGKTLREVRKGKRVSICKIADGYLSKSQISRFERGESEISCIRLMNILDKLNITLEEFLTIHSNENYPNNFINLIKYIQEEYSKQRFSNIKLLLNKDVKYKISSLERTMIKSIIYTFDKSIKPTKNELLELSDYLFKIEKWGYYEIILLGNCVRTLNYDTLFLLTREMVKNYFYCFVSKTNKRLVTELALNCLIASIDNYRFNHCNFLIQEIESLLKNELSYYEKTVFLYAKGYFELKQNNKIEGKRKMKQALQIFKLLDDKPTFMRYNEHYSLIFKDEQ